MIAHITRAAAGCNYCQAHTAHGAKNRGLAPEKIEAIWKYETSPLFTPSERAELALAQARGSVPNQATDAHFKALKQHYREDDIVEMVGAVSLFGLLNR